MRAMWKGSLSFGLVNIPISVYPGSEEHALDFHMLHAKDLSPIRFARICKHEDKEVPYSEIVKGFEYEKGEYVVITDQEFKEADPKKTSTIEIQHFSNFEDIAPLYYEKPYFLEPDKKSSKAYLLLHAALLRSNKVAIATYVFRNREHVGLILPIGDALVLIQMRYHNEIRSRDKLDLPKGKVAQQELDVALALIAQLTKPFHAEAHHDTYVASLMKVIDQKVKGKKPSKKKGKAEKVSPEVRDLMGLLKESMQKALSDGETKKKDIRHHEPKKVRKQKKSRRIS